MSFPSRIKCGVNSSGNLYTPSCHPRASGDPWIPPSTRGNDTYNFIAAPLREIRSFGYLKSRDKIKILIPHYICKNNFQTGNSSYDICFLPQRQKNCEDKITKNKFQMITPTGGFACRRTNKFQFQITKIIIINHLIFGH